MPTNSNLEVRKGIIHSTNTLTAHMRLQKRLLVLLAAPMQHSVAIWPSAAFSGAASCSTEGGVHTRSDTVGVPVCEAGGGEAATAAAADTQQTRFAAALRGRLHNQQSVPPPPPSTHLRTH